MTPRGARAATGRACLRPPGPATTRPTPLLRSDCRSRRRQRRPPVSFIHRLHRSFVMYSLTDYEWLSTSQIVNLRGRSHSHGPSDVPLLGETIGENLRATVERFGDRDAPVVAHQDYRATYDELWDEVEAAARAFIAHGVDR